MDIFAPAFPISVRNFLFVLVGKEGGEAGGQK